MKGLVKPQNTTFWVASNQLKGILHYGELSSKQVLNTHQPLLFYSLTSRQVAEMIYSEYEEYTEDEYNGVDELGEELEVLPETIFELDGIKIKSGTDREVLYSLYTDENMANMVIGAINTLVEGMTIKKINHKTENKWLVPFSQYAWDLMTPEQQAPLLTAKEAQDGNRLRKSDLILEDWNL
jgi:hypothetical protein